MVEIASALPMRAGIWSSMGKVNLADQRRFRIRVNLAFRRNGFGSQVALQAGL
jgi:hypothetical protein